jgi:hypothetical protein
VSEVIIKYVGTTVCQSNSKFVGWTDKEVVGNSFSHLLLVLISVICRLVASVLKSQKKSFSYERLQGINVTFKIIVYFGY